MNFTCIRNFPGVMLNEEETHMIHGGCICYREHEKVWGGTVTVKNTQGLWNWDHVTAVTDACRNKCCHGMKLLGVDRYMINNQVKMC